MEEFITIKENVQAQIIEKKSKFIANLFYIEDIKQAEEIIRDTKKKYFDARHNCYAYRVLENETIYEKSSDDRRAVWNCWSTNAQYFAKK